MSYVNGEEILPDELLCEIRKYYRGGLIYIPPQEKRNQWGTKTPTKKLLEKRNQEICQKKNNGSTIKELMEEYHLAYDTIKKIVYH